MGNAFLIQLYFVSDISRSFPPPFRPTIKLSIFGLETG